MKSSSPSQIDQLTKIWLIHLLIYRKNAPISIDEIVFIAKEIPKERFVCVLENNKEEFELVDCRWQLTNLISSKLTEKNRKNYPYFFGNAELMCAELQWLRQMENTYQNIMKEIENG